MRRAHAQFRPRTALLLGLLIPLAGVACGDDDDRDYDGSDHPDGIGNACTEDADCPTNECYLGPAGGYCTSECQDEGSTAQCPIDTVCKPIQGGARRCLLVCGTEHYCPEGTTCDSTWCPSGSSCVSVSDTDLMACEPEPG